MNHTGYKDLQFIGKSYAPYIGGIAKWWYTPIENLNGFPAINPENQQLATEPVLKAGKAWFGPVNVVDRQLGLSEPQTFTAAGPLWKRKVIGFIQGSDIESHINLGNLPFHQVCIVAKVRAGGFFIILGNNNAGLKLTTDYGTGEGQFDMPGTKIAFADECMHRSLVLPSFNGLNNDPPPSWGGGQNTSVMPEEIPLNNSGDTTLSWTPTRLTKYGNLPTIEIWAIDSDVSSPTYGKYYNANFPIESDGVPPTAFIIRNNGVNGVIKIS